MLVTIDDIVGLFPRQLEQDEQTRAQNLITAALELIEEEFLRHGRDFLMEAGADRLLQLTVKRVVREMVSEAVLIGENVGRSSANSTTGPQADAVTWSQGIGIHWGGVYMTDQWRRDLGLSGGARSMISSPWPKSYAEPVAWRNRGRRG